MTAKAMEEFLQSAKYLAFLEHSMEEWKACMQACQELRKTYKSEFAQKEFKDQEQTWKKLYWEAFNRYEDYKKQIGMNQ